MYRVQIQLSEEEADRVRELARTQGVSMAQVVREALTAYGSDRGAARALLDVAGKFTDREGRADIAQEHDRHVADAIAERIRAPRGKAQR